MIVQRRAGHRIVGDLQGWPSQAGTHHGQAAGQRGAPVDQVSGTEQLLLK